MGESLASKRIAWIDNAKAFAIFFIVFGHIILNGPLCHYVNSFHVPFFFFLSGLTFSAKKAPKEFFVEKVKRILVPYWVFSLISIALYLLLGEYASKELGKTDSLLSLGQCIYGMFYGARGNGLMNWNRPLWFLPCLFFLLSISYIIKRFVFRNSEKKLLTVISFAVCLGGFTLMYRFGFFPELPFGMTQAASASPFFTLGILVRQFLSDPIKPISLRLIFKIPLGVFFIAVGAYVDRINSYGVGFSYNRFGIFWAYFVAAFSGIFGWCLLASLFRFKALEYVGKNTLSVLLMHKFPIIFYSFLPIPDAGGNVPISIALSVLTVLLCLAAGAVIEKILPAAIGKPRKKAISNDIKEQ